LPQPPWFSPLQDATRDYPKVEQGRVVAFNKDTKEVTMIHDSAIDAQNPKYDVLPPAVFKLPVDPKETGPEPKAGQRLKLDTEKKEIEILRHNHPEAGVHADHHCRPAATHRQGTPPGV
jgi:hypothetical protein